MKIHMNHEKTEGQKSRGTIPLRLEKIHLPPPPHPTHLAHTHSVIYIKETI